MFQASPEFLHVENKENNQREIEMVVSLIPLVQSCYDIVSESEIHFQEEEGLEGPFQDRLPLNKFIMRDANM